MEPAGLDDRGRSRATRHSPQYFNPALQPGASTGNPDIIGAPLRPTLIGHPFHESSAPVIENRPSLLVVDDDPVTRARLEAYFSEAGYDIHAAGNGEKMWDVLHAQSIDVVLLDVGLPGKDGLELARELRAHDERLGIILVTGRSDDIDKIVGLESGADDYVTKPFNSRELLARVKIVLRGNRNRPAGQEQAAYRFGNWTIHIAQRRIVGSDGRRET